MKLPPFNFLEPDSLTEVCRVMADQNGKARIIAGGTELLPALKHRLKVPDVLVSLEKVPHLADIQYGPNTGLTLGPLVSLSRLANNDQVGQYYGLLATAALSVGSVQLQAMGTIGGNLCQDCCCIYVDRSLMLRRGLGPCYKLGGGVCHAVKRSPDCRAVYSGDMAAALFALNADVTLVDPTGEKRIPLRQMYSGDGIHPLTLKPGQILKAIHVPARSDVSGGTYLKLRMRKAIDYPLLGVAAAVTLEDDRQTCRSAAVALTGIGTAPLSIPSADQWPGRFINDELIAVLADEAYDQAHPVANALGLSPLHRRRMVRVYVKRAVNQALAEAKGGVK